MKLQTLCYLLFILANFTNAVACRKGRLRRRHCFGGNDKTKLKLRLLDYGPSSEYKGMSKENDYLGAGRYSGSGDFKWMSSYAGIVGFFDVYGYHGIGGIGSYYPYGMYKKKNVFSRRTTTNIILGMFVYHMASNLVIGLFGGRSSRMLVSVYSYYNQPEVKEDINLSSNDITLCEGNSIKLCTPGTTAICTTNSTILCVADMSLAESCPEEEALCINTTMPCMDPESYVCENATETLNETFINLPCFTNLFVDVDLLNETENGQKKDYYKYCVTMVTVVSPEYEFCNDTDKVSDYRSVLEGNYKWNLTIYPLRRSYNIYNFKHPTETPSGEVEIPTEVLLPCMENATNFCLPGVTPICTTFNEIMCLEPVSSVSFCKKYNTTCVKREVPCLENDPLCKDKTEEELIKRGDKTLVSFELPCFANVTVNSYFPDFNISSFNGTFLEGVDTKNDYHFHYCVTTLGIPGPEKNACLTILPDKKLSGK